MIVPPLSAVFLSSSKTCPEENITLKNDHPSFPSIPLGAFALVPLNNNCIFVYEMFFNLRLYFENVPLVI